MSEHSPQDESEEAELPEQESFEAEVVEKTPPREVSRKARVDEVGRGFKLAWNLLTGGVKLPGDE